MEEIVPSVYSVKFCTINNLDVFVRKAFKDLVLDTIKNLKADLSVSIYGYVIMTDHISMILGPQSQKDLNMFCERFKQKVSQKVMDLLEGENYTDKRWLLFLINFINKDNSESGTNKIWNLDYQSKLIEKSNLENELISMYARPVEEGLVSKAEDYNYSSIKENLIETLFLNKEAV